MLSNENGDILANIDQMCMYYAQEKLAKPNEI